MEQGSEAGRKEEQAMQTIEQLDRRNLEDGAAVAAERPPGL